MRNEIKDWICSNCRFAMPLPKSIINDQNETNPNETTKQVDISTLDDSKLRELYPNSSPGMIKNISGRIPQNIVKQIEQKYGKQLSFLANGSWGVVYDSGKKDEFGNVILVKITYDQSEIQANRILNKLKKDKRYESKCIVKIHNFMEIEIKDRAYQPFNHIGIIETKKVPLLTEEEKNWVGAITGFVFDNPTRYDKFDLFKTYVIKNKADLKNINILNIDGIGHEVHSKYSQLRKCIEKQEWSPGELTKDNIGKEKDRYILIDVGGLIQ